MNARIIGSQIVSEVGVLFVDILINEQSYRTIYREKLGLDISELCRRNPNHFSANPTQACF